MVITVKTDTHQTFTVDADVHFLNMIGIYAAEAGKRYEKENCPALAAEAKAIADSVYFALKDKGMYGKEKEE